ncbi:actin-related protein 10 [Periplaneta americana]|uniref:actin-related protein 10 n=1 Tax=Periplaneta americana TaxID=6978 RepID=UPI0037E7E58A
MPLYEGIGLTEKQAVVIDIGAAYTKFGFAGESGPRCIVRTEIRCPETKQVKKVLNYSSKEELYDLLVEFLHNLYFRHLLVSPKDRRVVVVESLLCPTVFRETLAKVFFRHFEVSSLLFVPSHLVSLCTLGVNTALILDVGYVEAVLIPVYEGVPVLHAWQAQPRAAEAVESSLKSMLLNHNEKEDFPDSTIEDIKVRTCFVTKLDRATKLDEVDPPPDVLYREGGSDTFTVPGKVREAAYEVLFEQDNDQISVATMILDAIVKCPIDMRKPLAENILVIGGTAMTPGFKARLLEELKHLLKDPKYASKLALKTFKFHKPPAKENYVAWLGGAIFGGTDMISTRSLTKEAYLKHNNVPDWADLSYNCREEDKISL